MSTKPKVSKKSSAILAVIFFIPALILYLLWASIGWRYGYIPEGEKQDIFLNTFPNWMQHFAAIHIVSIFLCVLAIIYASGSFKKRILSLRILMMIIVMFSIFIILFDIVQLI